MELKKIFVSHLPDKGSISRIYRLIQLRSKNKKTEPNERQTQTIQFKKWAEHLNKNIFQRRHMDGQEAH